MLLPSLALCLAGLILGALGLGGRKTERLVALIRSAAAELGLSTLESWGELRARGTVDGVVVEIDLAPRGLGDREDALAVTVRSSGIPRSLSLTATSAWSMLGQLFEGGRVFTGDEAFDAEVGAEGDEADVAALLDAETRRLAEQVIRTRGARVYLGRLELEVHHATRAAEDAAALITVVRELVHLAKRLSIVGATLPERLAAIATEDPNGAVRWKSLSLLLEKWPGTHAAERAARAALLDTSAELRLLGATRLPNEAFDVLGELATDEKATEDVRLRAVALVCRLYDRERALALLERVLDSSSYALRIQAVSSMASLGHYPAKQEKRIEELIASADARAIRAVAALLDTPAFRAVGAEEAFEPILVHLLGQDASIAAVAIEALGRIGSVHAVEPLLAFTGRILVDGALKQAARAAIAEIQARIDGADHGGLSLADAPAEGGALSLEDDAGAVSIVGDHHTSGKQRRD